MSIDTQKKKLLDIKIKFAKKEQKNKEKAIAAKQERTKILFTKWLEEKRIFIMIDEHGDERFINSENDEYPISYLETLFYLDCKGKIH